MTTEGAQKLEHDWLDIGMFLRPAGLVDVRACRRCALFSSQVRATKSVEYVDTRGDHYERAPGCRD